MPRVGSKQAALKSQEEFRRENSVQSKLPCGDTKTITLGCFMTQAVDRVNCLTLSVMLAMAIPLLLFPEASALALQTAYNFLALSLGGYTY